MSEIAEVCLRCSAPVQTSLRLVASDSAEMSVRTGLRNHSEASPGLGLLTSSLAAVRTLEQVYDDVSQQCCIKYNHLARLLRKCVFTDKGLGKLDLTADS